jgi:D-glycero-beta-D-manno-heptose-7-phosphate kinase
VDKKALQKIFGDLASLRIGVIGDLMLDSYMWGKAERISPEAPVPVVSLDHKENRIGGAGNVALNCRSLGAEVSIISITGDDTNAETLKKLLQERSITTGFISRSKERITTNKTRIISRNQQMMRLDEEDTRELSEEEENRLFKKVHEFISSRPDLVIFEDYNKGVLTEKNIPVIIELCRQHKVITAADPKRKNFFAYRHVDIFKPNLKEVKDALNIISDEIDESRLKNIHIELKKKLQHAVSLITLSEKGVFYSDQSAAGIIPTHQRNIADVSGAGDTVIAVAAMVYTLNKDVKLMAEMANLAGGLVCEEVGTVAINREKLIKECEQILA